MKTRIVVAAIIENDGKILLGKKRENIGPYPNTWHLPGGGADLEKETLQDAIIREIKEETGLDIKNLERVNFDEDHEPDKHGEMTHYVFLTYRAEAIDDKYQASDDIVELKWFEKTELKNIPLTRPSQKYFKEIGWI